VPDKWQTFSLTPEPSRVASNGGAVATAALSLDLILNLAPLMTFPAVLPEVATEWSLTSSQAGWIGGVYFAGYAVSVPFLASATDRTDGRRLYIGNALLGAISSLAFATLAHGYVAALALRFIGGIGLAGTHMPGLNLLMDRVSRSYQGRAAGIYTSTYAAGSATSYLLAGTIDASFGWHAAFLAAGVAPLLAIGTLALLPAASARRSDRPRATIRALLQNRSLIAYVAAFAGNTWEVFAVRVWFVAYLAWVLSLPGNRITLPALGFVAGIASLLGVPASIVMAEFAIRYGRRRVIIGICIASSATCLALAVTAGGPVWIVLPLLVLVQITSFADVGALAGGAVAAANPAQRGSALALYALAGFATGFAAPIAVGMSIDRFGGPMNAHGWTTAFIVIALGSLAAAIAVAAAPSEQAGEYRAR
jgi:MFS family permease